jgi:glycosyltransferase involved in cell wall biosynthesis
VSVLTTVAAEDGGAESAFERICIPAPGSRLFRRADALGAPGATTRAGTWTQRLRQQAGKALYWLRRKRGVLGSARMPDHHDPWVAVALRRVRGRQWDVVISTHGPYACHVVAWFLRRRGGAKRWVADFRDLWSDNHIFPGLPPFSWMEPFFERMLLRRADALTTVSEGLATRLGARHERAVSVIRNGIDLGDLCALDPRPAWPDDGLFRLVYTGTLYASGQDPSPLLHAIRNMLDAGEPCVSRLRLVFAGKFQADLGERLAGTGLAHITERPGFVSRAESLRMQRDAGALLFLPFISPVQDGILTGKLFEYLASGTEIVSVGRARDPSTAGLIEESGRGRDYGADTDAISAALRRLLSQPPEPKYIDLRTAARVDRRAANTALSELIKAL